MIKSFLFFITYIVNTILPNKGVISALPKITPTPNIISRINLEIPNPTPTPTIKPLTFKEQNELYGPCVYLPTLMYHHIQTEESAKINKQTSLTVYTDIFKSQMEYLKSKNYNTVSATDLISFFDNGNKIPSKSILLTFDDGYEDFYTDAYPILKSINFKAIMYISTGLVNNPGYLNWNQISEMNGSNILFANHTWSHKNVQSSNEAMKKEIKIADDQLTEHGFDNPKTFAYPYGLENLATENYLASLNYNFAFTTKPGSILCKKLKYSLPRIRVGNSAHLFDF